VIRGTFGWLAWLGLHLFYLVGFRNKIVVFINWSWRYLSWGSGPRIIVSEESVAAPEDSDFGHHSFDDHSRSNNPHDDGDGPPGG